MAENKQYITQSQENGSVSVSEDVIAAIVAHVATEVEGVAGLNARPGADIVELVGKKTSVKGVRITILENNSIAIDCNITHNGDIAACSVDGDITGAVGARKSTVIIDIDSRALHIDGIAAIVIDGEMACDGDISACGRDGRSAGVVGNR